MLIVNNLAPDDNISTAFSSELAASLLARDPSTMLLSLPYKKESFSIYNPSIIINVNFIQDFDSNARGFSIAVNSKSQLADLAILAFSRQPGLIASTSTGYRALPNTPYATYTDITLNIGYASNTLDTAWYTINSNRQKVIADLLHLWHGDYSSVDLDATPIVNTLPDPYFILNATGILDSIDGLPIIAYELNNSSLVLTPTYVESRNHIFICMAKSATPDSFLHVYTGNSTPIDIPIPSVNTWGIYTATALPATSPITIGTEGVVRITAIVLAPESIFGVTDSNYYYDDPRSTYRVYPSELIQLGINAAAGLFNKVIKSTPKTAEELLSALSKAPINSSLFTGCIEQLQKHMLSFAADAFTKIDLAKVQILYKDLEKKIPYITDCDKKQTMLAMTTMLKNAEVMVQQQLKSSLPEIISKNEKTAKLMQERAKQFSMRLK